MTGKNHTFDALRQTKGRVYLTLVERWATTPGAGGGGAWVFEAISTLSEAETKPLFDRRTGPNAPLLRFRRVLAKTGKQAPPPGAPGRLSGGKAFAP